jgi:hypothetical protein
VLPSHAVELTSAYLDRAVADVLSRHRALPASQRRKELLAAVIHLCGVGVGEQFVRNGFRVAAGERCANEDPAAYLQRIGALEAQFLTIEAGEAQDLGRRAPPL